GGGAHRPPPGGSGLRRALDRPVRRRRPDRRRVGGRAAVTVGWLAAVGGTRRHAVLRHRLAGRWLVGRRPGIVRRRDGVGGRTVRAGRRVGGARVGGRDRGVAGAGGRLDGCRLRRRRRVRGRRRDGGGLDRRRLDGHRRRGRGRCRLGGRGQGLGGVEGGVGARRRRLGGGRRDRRRRGGRRRRHGRRRGRRRSRRGGVVGARPDRALVVDHAPGGGARGHRDGIQGVVLVLDHHRQRRVDGREQGPLHHRHDVTVDGGRHHRDEPGRRRSHPDERRAGRGG